MTQSLKRQRVVALLNASAGSVGRQDNANLGETLTAAFERHGISATLEFLPAAELRSGAERAVRQAIDQELDAVVVGGGDGTIRTVASVLADSGVPLGIIPLGTLNHFAKDLGIPLALYDAVAVIAAGETRFVDAGEVNGEIFINNSSIGIYPYLVFDRERRRSSDGHAKWVAMLLAALRTLRNFPLRRLSIFAEGWSGPCRSPCVFVGNNDYCLAGRALGKRERLDGGELCLYVAKEQGRLALFWLACRSVLGLLDQSHDLRTVKVSAAEINSHTSRLLVACDGEVDFIRTPLRYRTRPAALRVFAPAAARA